MITKYEVILATFMFVQLMIGVAGTTWHLCIESVQRDAVKAGVAHYIEDENGNAKFEWKK